jgi:hypothetical protein
VQNSSQNTGKINHPERGTLLMDFEFIETVLELPEFRVISQVIRPNELE